MLCRCQSTTVSLTMRTSTASARPTDSCCHRTHHATLAVTRGPGDSAAAGNGACVCSRRGSHACAACSLTHRRRCAACPSHSEAQTASAGNGICSAAPAPRWAAPPAARMPMTSTCCATPSPILVRHGRSYASVLPPQRTIARTAPLPLVRVRLAGRVEPTEGVLPQQHPGMIPRQQLLQVPLASAGI